MSNEVEPLDSKDSKITGRSIMSKILLSTLVSAVSGSVANLLMDIAQFPLDSFKTRIQASSNRQNFVSSTKDISVYKGISAVLSSSSVYGFVFLMTYEKVKQKLADGNFLAPQVQHLVSAAVAESLGCLFRYLLNVIKRNPFEVVKQQMQIGVQPSMIASFKNIIKSNGFKGLYAGYFSLILREIPYSCIQFPIYEALKKRTLKKKVELSTIDTSINAFIAAFIAAGMTNPIDVVKTRLMTDVNSYYKNTFDCFQKIAFEEGYSSFLKAIHIRTLSIASTGVLFFVIYESLQKKLDKLL